MINVLAGFSQTVLDFQEDNSGSLVWLYIVYIASELTFGGSMYSLKCRHGFETREKIWIEKVKKTERYWLWTGNLLQKEKRPYGRIMIDGVRYSAHRLSYEMYKGDIPSKDMFICHTCDNPRCVNPDHLFLGSIYDNIMDCIAKNRHTKAAKHGSRRFSPEDILEMRRIYNDGEMNQREIAELYGIQRSYCTRIINRTCWNSV